MGWVSGIAIFFVIWWTVLFVILPIGVRTQADGQETIPGTAESAPVVPHLFRRAMATTVLAIVVFTVFYVATQIYGLSTDSFPRIIPGM